MESSTAQPSFITGRTVVLVRPQRIINTEHHRSALGWLTPQVVHYRQADQIRAARLQVLNEAYRLNQDRFVRKPPEPPRLPECVWINPPEPRSQSD